MNLAVLDLETNGFQGTSVLSVSAIVFSHEGRILDVYDRYYFPEEEFQRGALEVNGLYPERLAFLRKAGEYRSETFLEEADDFDGFLQDWAVENVIVHNVTFDTAFLPSEIVHYRKWWCSMRGMTRYVGSFGTFGRAKFPKLGELKLRLQGTMEAPEETRAVEEAFGGTDLQAHTSLADCLDLYGIVMRVLANRPEFVRFLPMAPCFNPPGSHYPARRGHAEPRADSFVLSHLKLKRCFAEWLGQEESVAGLDALIEEGETSSGALDPGEEGDPLLAAVRRAMLRGETVRIRFTSTLGEVTEREILPIDLFRFGNQPQLKAFCHLRGEHRIFDLSRTEFLGPGKGGLS